uniref:C2H2-type domain-containing protein n=1 Tax=Fagus sylvatica TaxID=28930 RepID=A0A2N9FMF6_FAGSY
MASGITGANCERSDFNENCHIYKVIFPTKAELNNHLKSHNTDHYKCFKCDRYFESKLEREDHMKIGKSCNKK